jgi:hypothetical protein
MNRAMVFAEGTADLMQRFSRLPTAPDLGLLRRRKTIPSTWSHEHHLQKQMISIRWCCIHRLSSHSFSGSPRSPSDKRWTNYFRIADKRMSMRGPVISGPLSLKKASREEKFKSFFGASIVGHEDLFLRKEDSATSIREKLKTEPGEHLVCVGPGRF